MNAKALQQLAWKECTESISGLALGIFLLGGFTMVATHSRLIPDFVVIAMTLVMGWLFAGVYGMSPVAAERHAGTMGFLMTLPFPAWQLLLVKLLVAAINVTIPLMVAGMVYYLMAGQRELPVSIVWRGYAGGMFGAVGVLLWTVCLGICQPTEARVGLLIIVVFFGAWMIMGFVVEVFHLSSRILLHIVAATPFGSMVVLDERARDINMHLMRESMVLNLIIWSTLFIYAAWRMAKPAKTRG